MSLNALGKELRSFRKKNRYQVQHMLEITGFSKSNLWALTTRNDINPRLETMIVLAKFMHKSVGFIANLAAESRKE